MIKTIKSITFIALITCFTANMSYGQIDGLKNKVKNKAKKTVNKPNSSSSDSNKSVSLKSPAESQINKFRSAYKNGKNYVSRELETINGGSSSNKTYAEEKLEICKNNLAEIKKLDPKFGELEQFEKDYNELQGSFDKHMLSREYYIAFKKAGSDFYSLSQKKIDRFPKDRHYKTMLGFDSLCASMKEDGIDHQEVLKLKADAIKTRDQDKVDIVQNIMRITDYHLTDSKKLSAEERKKDSYIEYFEKTDNNPDVFIKRIKENLEVINKVTNYYKNDTIAKSIKSLESRMSDIEGYKNSGAYENDIKKKESYELDLIRLPKPGSQNTSANISYIKSHWKSEWGTLKKVVFKSNSWEIEKNIYGIPKYKEFVGAVSVTNNDGTCYKTYVYIVKKYTGGGTYASKEFVRGSSTKMDCANLLK